MTAASRHGVAAAQAMEDDGSYLRLGRRVGLRPLATRDYEFVYDLYTEPAIASRINRFGGSVPSPDQVMARLWENVLSQSVIVGASSGRRIGLAVVASPDFRNRFAYFSVLSSPEAFGTGLALEGAALAIDSAFDTWDFRKIYCEVAEMNVAQFARIGRYMQLEARFRHHAFANDMYQDVFVHAIYREQWRALVTPRLRRASPR